MQFMREDENKRKLLSGNECLADELEGRLGWARRWLAMACTCERILAAH
jgi:hypothetical protein